jgi:hypothetical protein
MPILRTLAAPGFTTKGAPLSHAEGDTNLIELYQLLQALPPGLATYDPTKTYPAGTAVIHQGQIYQATTQATGPWNPALWVAVPTPVPAAFPTWDNAATYALDDDVSYNLRLYRSLANGNTGNAPDTNPALWVELSPSDAPFIPDWVDGDLYSANQVVVRGGRIWRVNPARTTPFVSTNATWAAEVDALSWMPLEAPQPHGVLISDYTALPTDTLLRVDTTTAPITITLPDVIQAGKLEILRVAGTHPISLETPGGQTLNGQPSGASIEAALISIYHPFNNNYTMINSQEGGTVTQVSIDLTGYVNTGGIDAAGAVDLSVFSTAYTDQGLAYDDQVIDADRPFVRKAQKDIQVLELRVPGPNSGDQYFCALRGVPVNVGTVRLRLHPGVGNDNLVLVDQDDAAAPTIPAGAVPLRLRNDAQAVLSGAEGDFIDLTYDATQNMWFQTGGMSF